jgi:hypothetical protein
MTPPRGPTAAEHRWPAHRQSLQRCAQRLDDRHWPPPSAPCQSDGRTLRSGSVVCSLEARRRPACIGFAKAWSKTGARRHSLRRALVAGSAGTATIAHSGYRAVSCPLNTHPVSRQGLLTRLQTQRLSRPIHVRNRPITARSGRGKVPVPHPVPIGLQPSTRAPRGVNQTVANGSKPGSYRFSDAPTFTLDVDILQEGDRLGNAHAGCAVAYQGALS